SAQLSQPVHQGLAHTDGAAGTVGRFQNELARVRVLGNEVEVAAARGDDEGFAEPFGQQAGGHAVGVVVVGVDDVEVETLALQALDQRQGRERHGPGGAVHAYLGQQQVARVEHLQPVAVFVPGRGGKL